MKLNGDLSVHRENFILQIAQVHVCSLKNIILSKLQRQKESYLES